MRAVCSPVLTSKGRLVSGVTTPKLPAAGIIFPEEASVSRT